MYSALISHSCQTGIEGIKLRYSNKPCLEKCKCKTFRHKIITTFVRRQKACRCRMWTNQTRNMLPSSVGCEFGGRICSFYSPFSGLQFNICMHVVAPRKWIKKCNNSLELHYSFPFPYLLFLSKHSRFITTYILLESTSLSVVILTRVKLPTFRSPQTLRKWDHTGRLLLLFIGTVWLDGKWFFIENIFYEKLIFMSYFPLFGTW